MTISSTTNRKEYTGNGSTTSFATSPVVFFDTADLKVYVVTTATGAATLLTENTHYSVTGGSGAVGTVSLAGGSSPYGAPSASQTLVIVRELALVQGVDFVNNEATDAEVAEDALDKLTLMAQQLDARLDRAFAFADSDVSGASPVIPAPVADAVIKWNSGATALEAVALAGVVTAGVPVSTFMATVLDDANQAAANATLGSIPQALVTTKGDIVTATASGTAARLAVGAAGTVPLSRAAATTGLAYSAVLNKAIYGLTYANNGSDATNDLDIAAGGCMDATGAYWITTAALTKQSDAAWAVGTNAGGLDTGAVGNNDYYIWAIARSDTGVTDILYSLSSTAPTMPTGYDFKRLIGWFKRSGGTIVAFHTYETEGGGLELSWDVPTLDINLANTLTTARRTDAVKVPLNFSVIANLNIYVQDASSNFGVWVCCPDQTDAAPASGAAPLGTFFGVSTQNMGGKAAIRTSAAGLVAARADLATVDLYRVSTLGFNWARRN